MIPSMAKTRGRFMWMLQAGAGAIRVLGAMYGTRTRDHWNHNPVLACFPLLTRVSNILLFFV